MSKSYQTPNWKIVVKTRMTDDEYADFTERARFCEISQSEFIRRAIDEAVIKPIITSRLSMKSCFRLSVS